MDLISDRGNRVSVDELNTTRLLAHARKQADKLGLDDILIIDSDSHHYEGEHIDEVLPFFENEVFKQLVLAGRSKGRGSLLPSQTSFQDMGGRITRYPLRSSEKTDRSKHRDIQLGNRWMDALSVDYACLFPTQMLHVGLTTIPEIENNLCWAYNRWLTEKILPEADNRFFSMLCLPFSDPEESLRQVEKFGGCMHVTGFCVTAIRTLPVHHNSYMKVYRAIEERGLSLSFHSGTNSGEPLFKSLNRFATVHALGFPWYNMLHMSNWITNGLGERFPKMPVIWIEGGLAWVPFLMQRLDHEYMLRTSEYPGLKKLPSDYMRDMFYTTQPMEVTDMTQLESTFRMLNAETQLLYASDYPHWDFDVPSKLFELPFLTDRARHNILGGNAARLFKLPPRTEKQRATLEKFGGAPA